MGTENGNVVALAKPAEQRDASRAFEPNNLDEAYRLAKIFVAGRLLPKSIQTPEAAFTILATGRELGLTAMQSLRSLNVIDGKIVMPADLMLALVKRHPACRYFRLVATDDKIATYETHRDGEPEPTRLSWTWEQATRAGLAGKDNWKKYPEAMIRARCIAALVRAVYPDSFMAIYDPDELAAEPAQGRTAPLARVEVELQEQTPAAPGVSLDPRKVAQAVADVNAVQEQIGGAPMSEDTEDRWATFAQKVIDAISEATTTEAVKSWLSRIKTIPEPFQTPVRESYTARLKAIRDGVSR